MDEVKELGKEEIKSVTGAENPVDIKPVDESWRPQIPDNPAPNPPLQQMPQAPDPALWGPIEIFPCPKCGSFNVLYLGKTDQGKNFRCRECQTEYSK